MLAALIKFNTVVELREIGPEDYEALAKDFESIVDVSNYKMTPKVGWVLKGNVIINGLPPVTPRQIRQALRSFGVSPQTITDALNSLPEPMRGFALDEWEYSTAVERSRPLVSSMGAMMGWTEDQIDSLWIFAGSIK